MDDETGKEGRTPSVVATGTDMVGDVDVVEITAEDSVEVDSSMTGVDDDNMMTELDSIPTLVLMAAEDVS